MDSEDKGMGVTEGSSKETKKRGRPKKNADPPKKHSVSREKNADPPIIHSVSPSLIAESPPPGFPSKFLVWPVKNRTSLATGSVSAGVSQSKAVHGSVSAGGSQSKATPGAVSENLASGAKHKLAIKCPEPKYKLINMENEEFTGRQAQMQLHQFASTFSELNNGFESAKKKIKELGKQVPDLTIQIQKWNDEKASWDLKMKELERERDEAREEALKAVGEKRDLEKKLEKAAKEAEDAKASAKRAIDERRDLKVKLEKATRQAGSVDSYAKKAISDAAIKFVEEKRDLEEKLEKAVKQVEDAQASGKKAIYEAVASTTNCFKICLDKFVASLGNGEDKSLEDHVSKLVKAIPYDARALTDVTVEVSGHEGDGDNKEDAAGQSRMSQRAPKSNPKYA
ncbi:uncharacterized protein LOC108195463 isoform X2 [Daucus carota subsp. sativus]|uniref:uncharacterized protein LOC108195463 isoform X2 n=1 Tax=Daucus carota subsp. sativus TaxID=79200 RepID=UPI0030828053